VVEAPDGERALELLDDADPDVVLLDLQMPVKDGWEVLEALREWERDVKVIIFSANAERARERAEDLGCDAFVQKPYERRELLDAVAAAMD
jgi:CheY-like chemotaxis protein